MAASDDIGEVADERSEAELWHALKAGKRADAREKLFELHRAFARQVAAKHYLDRKSGDIEFADLSQLACTGLLEAIDRYDPEYGTPFRAYARPRISGSILDGIAHMSELREQLSYRQRARKERIKSLEVSAPEKLEANAAMEALVELATHLAIGFMIEGTGVYVEPGQADAGQSPYDSLAWKERVQSLKRGIAQLSQQEEKVIRYHYLDGLSFEHIAAALGLSKGRISQIHKAALISLKQLLSPATLFTLNK